MNHQALSVASGFFSRLLAVSRNSTRRGVAQGNNKFSAWPKSRPTTIVIGPNTHGVINLHRPIVAAGDKKTPKVVAGCVSGVFQSGQMVTMMHPLMSRGIGISKIVTTGNEVSATTAELINFFADDDSCHRQLLRRH